MTVMIMIHWAQHLRLRVNSGKYTERTIKGQEKEQIKKKGNGKLQNADEKQKTDTIVESHIGGSWV